jgi:hypothetical protein
VRYNFLRNRRGLVFLDFVRFELLKIDFKKSTIGGSMFVVDLVELELLHLSQLAPNGMITIILPKGFCERINMVVKNEPPFEGNGVNFFCNLL